MATGRRGSRKSAGWGWDMGIPVKYRSRLLRVAAGPLPWPFRLHAAGHKINDYTHKNTGEGGDFRFCIGHVARCTLDDIETFENW